MSSDGTAVSGGGTTGGPGRDADAGGRWPPTFDGGLSTVAGFLLAFAGLVAVSNLLFVRVGGTGPVAEGLWDVPSGVAQLAVGLAVLRYEGVALADIGLARRLVAPALAATAAVVVLANAAVAGLVLASGEALSVGPYAFYRGPPLNYSVAALVATGVSMYAVTGPVEELLFRGYLQNRLADVPGGGHDRVHAAFGILGASVAFSALHVPALVLVRGEPLGGVAGTLVLLAVTGVTFGTVYALTRNLYLVVCLHGIGNFWPLFVDYPAGLWPNYGVILVLYGLVVVAYRRWAPAGPSPGRGVGA